MFSLPIYFIFFQKKEILCVQKNILIIIQILSQDEEKDESSNPFVTLCLFKLSM